MSEIAREGVNSVGSGNEERRLACGMSGSRDEDERAVAVASSVFQCRLCRRVPSEPVLTRCGHLFCWPCLFVAASCAVRGPAFDAECVQLCARCAKCFESSDIVPVYVRRGCRARQEDDAEVSSSPALSCTRQAPTLCVPPRPHARWVEKARIVQGEAYVYGANDSVESVSESFQWAFSTWALVTGYLWTVCVPAFVGDLMEQLPEVYPPQFVDLRTSSEASPDGHGSTADARELLGRLCLFSALAVSFSMTAFT